MYVTESPTFDFSGFYNILKHDYCLHQKQCNSRNQHLAKLHVKFYSFSEFLLPTCTYLAVDNSK